MWDGNVFLNRPYWGTIQNAQEKGMTKQNYTNSSYRHLAALSKQNKKQSSVVVVVVNLSIWITMTAGSGKANQHHK